MHRDDAALLIGNGFAQHDAVPYDDAVAVVRVDAITQDYQESEMTKKKLNSGVLLVSIDAFCRFYKGSRVTKRDAPT